MGAVTQQHSGSGGEPQGSAAVGTFSSSCRRGQFHAGWERVFRTQQAVRQSVKKLEEAVGAPLFARDTPELTLTEAGHALVDYA
ncbi:MAG: LysR family transcriptional regulator [Candidatus Acidiferrales bacterium]